MLLPGGYGRSIKQYRTKTTLLHCIFISEGLARMDDRQMEFDPPNREGLRRGRLVSRPESRPDIVRHVIEEPLPDVDANDGRFGAPNPQLDPMYADAALDPVPGPIIATDELRQDYASASSQGKHVLNSVPEPREWRARD